MNCIYHALFLHHHRKCLNMVRHWLVSIFAMRPVAWTSSLMSEILRRPKAALPSIAKNNRLANTALAALSGHVLPKAKKRKAILLAKPVQEGANGSIGEALSSGQSVGSDLLGEDELEGEPSSLFLEEEGEHRAQEESLRTGASGKHCFVTRNHILLCWCGLKWLR